MRKNSIRKLIHGILDLLPLFVIPIFAININQKSVEPISIEVQEEIVVDFNQLAVNGNWTYTSYTFSNDNGYYNFNVLREFRSPVSIFSPRPISRHKYFVKFTKSDDMYKLQQDSVGMIENNTVVTIGSNINNFYIWLDTTNYQNFPVGEYYGEVNFIDLTQMYGVGNEPTAQEFLNKFGDNVYPYTESQKMLVDKPTPTTYDDTDIGSQFLYSLYISTDNYFNMNNVFNLNGVYSWFEMNIFGGSAPLSIYIVWNIIIYELVMDLLMLLYALFMFFIDACQKLIDKPLESIK